MNYKSVTHSVLCLAVLQITSLVRYFQLDKLNQSDLSPLCFAPSAEESLFTDALQTRHPFKCCKPQQDWRTKKSESTSRRRGQILCFPLRRYAQRSYVHGTAQSVHSVHSAYAYSACMHTRTLSSTLLRSDNPPKMLSILHPVQPHYWFSLCLSSVDLWRWSQERWWDPSSWWACPWCRDAPWLHWWTPPASVHLRTQETKISTYLFNLFIYGDINHYSITLVLDWW